MNSKMYVTLHLSLVLCMSGSARGVVNIRNESWHVPQSIGPADVPASVTFDADLTPLDRYYGISFSILLMTADRGSQSFLKYTLDSDQELPPVGTKLELEVNFLISCVYSLHGTKGSKGSALVHFLNQEGIQETRLLTDTGRRSGFVVMGRGGGLALRDENAALGPTPMALDGIACTPRDPNLAPGYVDAGTIGVYFDPAGTRCEGTISPDAPGMVYVVAKMSGVTVDGIAGAEFKFSGVPASWRVFPVANPDLIALGDPFGDGVVMGLPCERPQEEVVVLYSVMVQASAAEPDVQFSIEMRKPPLNQDFQCPLLLECDYTMFTKHCVTGQSCFVNSSRSRSCARPTGVDQKTWTQVKAFYR